MAEFYKKMFDPPVDQISFDSFTKFPLFLFRLMFFGFEPRSIGSTTKGKIVSFIKISYFYICVFQLALMISSMISYVIHHSDDFVDASSALTNVVTVGLVAVKTLVTLYRKQEIWELFQELKAIFDENSGRDRKNVKSYLDKYNRTMKIFAGPFALMYLQLIVPIILYFATGKMLLTVKFHFPIDIFRPVIFPLALCWIGWVGSIGLNLMLATDGMIFSLTTFLSMELNELVIDLGKLNSTKEDKKRELMRSLIDRHNKLLDICDKLQDIFGLIFFFSFTINAFGMCFIAFQLSTVHDFTSYSFFIPYMGLIGGHTYLLCSFGQKLINSSELVAQAVFNCGWEDFSDVVVKREVILMLLRAQKPKKLTAIGFADASLVNFTSILKATYSYLTLLRHVYSRK